MRRCAIAVVYLWIWQHVVCSPGPVGSAPEQRGRGFAGGFAGAGLDGRGQEPSVGGVAGGDLGEAGDGAGFGEGGESLGLAFGGGGQRVEDGHDLGGLEEVEQFADAEVVVGGEIGEGEVAAEVVVDEGVGVGGCVVLGGGVLVSDAGLLVGPGGHRRGALGRGELGERGGDSVVHWCPPSVCCGLEGRPSCA
ncbi:MAG: hypothetical protein HND58_11435 [Planctomycetota bacterium]|nr:MAG: hypothetical protein HND58_11435 [Planctomycetota bacterium]